LPNGWFIFSLAGNYSTRNLHIFQQSGKLSPLRQAAKR
jgi:hypothetical protein